MRYKKITKVVKKYVKMRFFCRPWKIKFFDIFFLYLLNLQIKLYYILKIFKIMLFYHPAMWRETNDMSNFKSDPTQSPGQSICRPPTDWIGAAPLSVWFSKQLVMTCHYPTLKLNRWRCFLLRASSTETNLESGG